MKCLDLSPDGVKGYTTYQNAASIVSSQYCSHSVDSIWHAHSQAFPRVYLLIMYRSGWKGVAVGGWSARRMLWCKPATKKCLGAISVAAKTKKQIHEKVLCHLKKKGETRRSSYKRKKRRDIPHLRPWAAGEGFIGVCQLAPSRLPLTLSFSLLRVLLLSAYFFLRE